MLIGNGRLRLARTVTAFLALFLSFEAGAGETPRAVELGPVVSLMKPSGGFVGRLTVTPDHGPAGTPVKVTAVGLPPDQEFQLVWRTVKGSWKIKGPQYRGRKYEPVAYRVAKVKSSAAGEVLTTFAVPEDFGFSHDIVLQREGRLYNKAGFNIDMTVKLSPKSGPVGTPITVDVKGIGWRYLQNSWMLLYDNNFTGWVSSVTTGGSAEFTIPATGNVGTHVLEMMHGAFTFPYRNTQQNPMPGQPLFALKFNITPGNPALPPAPEQQLQTSVRGLPAAGELVTSPRFSGIGQPVVARGSGFTAGKTYKLNWTTVSGNRITGPGWSESSRVIKAATADAAGNLKFSFKVPDDLGGAHKIWVQDGAGKKAGSYWVTPTALPLDVNRGPAGTAFSVHLKGVG